MIGARFSIPADFRARVTAMVPAATDADFDRLGIMFAGDVVIRDDASPHPAFVAWVADILGRQQNG